MVFYRTYRPQSIQELDSDSVRETLSAILRSKEIPHAFLFSGPKGLGKTSAARILAKVVNCERKGKTSEPCNKCAQCSSITHGTNLDVLEIDAASNRGIDEIRDLREKIKLYPAKAQMKVYIIDEAHMLTREAFNALLKTLEEPPRHAMFILATTEFEKLPETIASRLFHVPFTRARDEEIVRSLSRIIKGERIKIEKEAILAIAKQGDGSFRDAAKLLEKLKALSGRKKITRAVLEKEERGSLQIEAFLEHLAKRDSKEALVLLERMVERGANVKTLTEQLLYSLHRLLLSRMGIVNSEVDSELSAEELKQLLAVFEKAAVETKTAVIAQLPLELAIIEWSSRNAEEDQSTGRLPHVANDAPADFLNVLIKKVEPHNHSIAGVLRGCKLKQYDGKKLVIETSYKFHKDRLSDKESLRLIERMCGEISGGKVTASILLKDGVK